MLLPVSNYLLTDLLRTAIVFSIKLFFALCVVQLVALVVHKTIVERRERREAQLKSRYLALMILALGEKRHAVARPETREEYAALADVLIYLMTGASKAELGAIRATVRDCGIARFFSDRLARSRFWITRYKLIEKLGFLRLPELAPLFRSVIDNDHEDRHVAGKATWALSLICTEEDLPHILARVSLPDFMSAKFNEHLFVNIIHSFRDAGRTGRLLELFGELLEKEPVPLLVKRDFIEACGGAGLAEARQLVVSSMRRYADSPEMRIAALRSLQKLGGETLDLVVLDGLADPDWRVRAVAAKSVERCSDRVVGALERALGDQSYYVRVNAALSLAHKGEAGRAALERQRSSQDRFVREVSRYVMQERDLPC